MTSDDPVDQPLIDEMSCAEAQATLSDVMDRVVRRRCPVEVHRPADADQMLLVDRRQLIEVLALAGQRFDAQVTVAEDEVSVSLRALGLIGAGATFDEAVDELLDVLRIYSKAFLDRWAFHMQTDRATLASLIFLFALTPADEQRDLLIGAP